MFEAILFSLKLSHLSIGHKSIICNTGNFLLIISRLVDVAVSDKSVKNFHFLSVIVMW